MKLSISPLQFVYLICYGSGLFLADITANLLNLGVSQDYVTIAAKLVGTIAGLVGFLALGKTAQDLPPPPEVKDLKLPE